MTIEILYLTAQFQRWLNLQVARHLEAQVAKLIPASPEGIGMSGLKRGVGKTDHLESIEDVATLAPYSGEGSVALHGAEQTVQT